MEEIELKSNDIPSGYALCFNSDCAKKENCMHYQAALVADVRDKGQAVYPAAWRDCKCRCYSEKRLVQNAWGFSQLYENIPKFMRAEARRRVSALFGSGNGPYYRAHHGENMLSPKEQEEIMEVLKKFGSTEGVKFDHYVTAWDFE